MLSHKATIKIEEIKDDINSSELLFYFVLSFNKFKADILQLQ